MSFAACLSERRLRATSIAFALLFLLPAGCDGGSGGRPTETCTRDSECGADEYCDFGTGRSSMGLLDPECFVMCLANTCTPGDRACELACADSCGGAESSCAQLCDDLCAPGPGAPSDPLCVSSCVPDCEDRRGEPPPPPPIRDAGVDPEPDPDPEPAQGTCRPRAPAPTRDGGTPPPPPADSGTPPAPIDWTGTWSIRAQYTATCMWSSLGAPNTVNLDFTVTARLTGANDDLTAVLANDSGYTMIGSGSDSRLTLSGQFPGRDHNDNAATTVMRDNSVTLSIDEVVDHGSARGTIDGSYETSGGVSCDIGSGGVIELTR